MDQLGTLATGSAAEVVSFHKRHFQASCCRIERYTRTCSSRAYYQEIVYVVILANRRMGGRSTALQRSYLLCS